MNHLASSNGTKGAVTSAFYGIRWAHTVAGLPSPTEHPFVQTALEGAQRLLSTAVKKKEPITPALLSQLAQKHGGPTADLKDLWFLFICLVGYAGFMRIDELTHLRKEHVVISDHSMTLHLPGAKTDQHRQGNTIFVARTNTPTCPVTITERYMRAMGDSLTPDSYLLLRFVRTKEGLRACSDKQISYARIRANT